MVQLRKRNPVSYATLQDIGDDETDSPNAPVQQRAESPASDSEFSAGPPVQEESDASEGMSDAEGEDADDEPAQESDDDDESVVQVATGSSKRRRTQGVVLEPDGLTSKLATLPVPQRQDATHARAAQLQSLASRYALLRPWPVYIRDGRPWVLSRQPDIFKDTDAELLDLLTTKRDPRHKWKLVLSPGPAWQLMEDKSWYKEYTRPILGTGDDMEVDTGSSASAAPSNAEKQTRHDVLGTRPLAYENVSLKQDDISILQNEEALPFIPRSKTDGDRQVPLSCYFGPYPNQSKRDMNPFDTISISEFIPGNTSHVFSAGAPVWGIDWCPIADKHAPHRAGKQYVAVGPFPSREYSPKIGIRTKRPSVGSIQIWSFHLRTMQTGERLKDDPGTMTCEMVLGIDSGPAYMVKWCPLPSHDSWSPPTSEQHAIRKLGILAGVFADGSLSFFAIPDPEDMKAQATRNNGESVHQSGPVFVRINKPILRIELDDSPFLCLDWANSELVVAGCSGGNVVVYKVNEHIEGRLDEDILPKMFVRAHQSAIRSIAWIRTPPADASGRRAVESDPTIICSVGYDGATVFTDIREQLPVVMNRYRDVINSVQFSPWAGGVILTEYDTVKWFNMSPHVIGRGHLTMTTGGPVWALASSDFHPYLASGAADGFLQTTNLLRVPKKGYNNIKLIHRIYQIEYNRSTSEYRMLENFLPVHPSGSRGNTVKNAKRRKKGKAEAAEDGNGGASVGGAWPPESGVHCLAWNPNGLSKAHLLVSGTASGLCRVDVLSGWLRKDIKEKAPTTATVDDDESMDEV